MNVQYASIQDINHIIDIIDQSKAYFKESHINQWQDGYPNRDTFNEDILNNKCFVLKDNDLILGTMYFAIEEDPTYKDIEGSWLTNAKYAVIHRIAVLQKEKGRGYAQYLLDYAIKTCIDNNIESIRIDTHIDNKSMQSFLKRHGFTLCGTVTLPSGDSRIAFELLVHK